MRPVSRLGTELQSVDRIRRIRWSIIFFSNLRPLSKLSVRRLEFETPIEVQPSQVSMAGMVTNMEEFEEALASSRYAGGCGGAQPHRPNGTDRARRPKADEEGQGAEGTSAAEGRLEGQRDQRDPVPMGEISPTAKWTKKSGLGTKMDMKSTKFLPVGLKLATSILTFSCESSRVHGKFR